MNYIDPFAVFYTHESYILYTPYHTYWIRIRVRFFPENSSLDPDPKNVAGLRICFAPNPCSSLVRGRDWK